VFEQAVASLVAPGFRQHGLRHDLCELSRRAGRSRLLQRIGLGPGGAGGDHAAQPAQYGGACSACCARLIRGQLSTRSHPAQLEHQLKDSGPGPSSSRHFVTCWPSDRNTRSQQAIVTEIGDLLPFWKPRWSTVVRHIKKMVPHYHLPGAIGFNEALARGGRRTLQNRSL